MIEPSPFHTSVDQELPDDAPWGSLRWMVSQHRVAGADITFGYVEILPGAANDRHLHPNCEEVLFLIEGQLDHAIGDEVVTMTAGSLLHIPAGTAHQARNSGTVTARMVVAYPTGDRRFEPVR